MVRSCSLKNCNNSVKQKYRFFLLPSVKKVAKRSAWLKKCGHLLPDRLPTHGNSISLCEGHFEPDQFVEYGPNIRTILKPTAVPTIFIRNPPRVCDAIESLYEETMNEENIDAKTCESDETGEGVIEEQLTINTRLHNNDEDLLESQVDDTIIPKDKPKLQNKLYTADGKNKKTIVQLLQIKKNCMVVSSKQGTEIISTSSKEIFPDVNEQSQGDEKNSESSPFSSCINNQVKRVERNQESTSTTLLSPKNKKIALISKRDQLVTMRLSESGKKLIHIQPSDLTETFKNECPVTIKCEKLNENVVRHYTVSSTTNVDDGNINVDESEEVERLSGYTCDSFSSGISSSSRPHDNSMSEYRTSIEIDPFPSTNADDSPIPYSLLSKDTATLRKRVHDLEVERDNATRKYRHLALRLETFETNLRIFLNDDQIRLLESESLSLNTTSWSAETLQKSAKIRCIVGPRAYEYLRSHEHYPLPSFRTLYRHRDISKINEYTDEIIQDHMNSTINEVAAMGAEDSEVSDDDFDEEHIKIEMLEPEYENSMECQDDARIVESHESLSGPEEISDEKNVIEFVSVDVDESNLLMEP